MRLVDPLAELGSSLHSVQVPSRYLGGEYGATIKAHTCDDDLYNAAIAFPDLYEIGMSNLAIKIIYNALNAFPMVRCERVFAPDTDFEALLKKNAIPLYTLETGMALHDLDLLAFSVGYELGATEILAMLDSGGIPLLAATRDDTTPLVIAGGCGITNPAPLGAFFDAIMIGEAEAGLFSLVEELAYLKKKGAGRREQLAHIATKPFMWTAQTDHTVRRAVQARFGLEPSIPTWFPQPSTKPVQDHGVVEIMRGCPNGCRFCHAGIYYRPARVKNTELIIDEIDHLVFDAGYREISLNSLSSADFPHIESLLDILHERYRGYNVSFQLPSLKVNSMSLPLLQKLSTVRKSGLTFAVETPEEAWQLSLNKEVYAQHLVKIITEAKAKGWSSAKFYFMIGLPVGDYFADAENPDAVSEEKMIVDFLLALQKQTHIQCNVNVGVFIPKPHTPYQWVRQLSLPDIQRKMDYLYKNLPRGKFRLGHHNYDMTLLEGLLSRGDERVSHIILNAYHKGVRFDAWDDHLKQNMPYWREAMAEENWDVMGWIYQDWDMQAPLPWDCISLGPSKAFYQREWLRSQQHVLTKRCAPQCASPCGICNAKDCVHVHTTEQVQNAGHLIHIRNIARIPVRQECNIPVLYRVIFSFARCKGGEYTAYLTQVEIFHKAILRSGLPFVFTAGFNPLPRIEFATAMALGIASYEEIASCYLYDPCTETEFLSNMNAVLPRFFQIQRVSIFPVSNLRKRESLSQNLWGARYRYHFLQETDTVFFESDAFHSLCAAHPDITIEGSSIQDGDFFLCMPTSDKIMRVAIEEYFHDSWYKIVSVEKTHTLATYVVGGWTAADEEQWRNHGDALKKDTTLQTTETGPLASFFTLYDTIARINAELITTAQQLKRRQDVFYVQHPEVLAQRKKKERLW